MYWILFIFLLIGAFFPIAGFLALICMAGPVMMARWRGRYWCGHICPRGSFYDHIMTRFSPRQPLPRALRRRKFRMFMLAFIFSVFGIQAYAAGNDAAALGMVFLRIIVLTTIVGMILSLKYQPRAWCAFCPMGTLSNWLAPGKNAPDAFQVIEVSDQCVQCGLCAKVCPMELRPQEAKNSAAGFQHGDCLKCGACIAKCPKGALRLR